MVISDTDESALTSFTKQEKLWFISFDGLLMERSLHTFTGANKTAITQIYYCQYTVIEVQLQATQYCCVDVEATSHITLYFQFCQSKTLFWISLAYFTALFIQYGTTLNWLHTIRTSPPK